MQTAEILAAALGEKTKVVQRKELLPGGDAKHLLAATEKLASGLDQVAWVGHARNVGYLAARADRLGKRLAGFEEGAIAALGFPASPEFGRGELQWLVTAKILGV